MMLYFSIAKNIDHRYCQHHQPSTLASAQSVSNTMSQTIEEDKETTLDKIALKEYLDTDGHYDDALCNVFRSGVTSKQKISTYGFLATFLSCSVIVGFTEQPCSEGSTYKTLIFFIISI